MSKAIIDHKTNIRISKISCQTVWIILLKSQPAPCDFTLKNKNQGL